MNLLDYVRVPQLHPSRRTLAIISQVYVPDPASVGQHLHDVAVEMVRREFDVVVFTSNRGYEDPSVQYAGAESIAGVHVVRLPWSSFGKGSVTTRMLGGTSFLAQAIALTSRLARLDHVLVTTSPPMGGVAGAVLQRLRGVPFTFWAMDLNPDQIVASGGMSATALPVRGFDRLNHVTLRAARTVVALDRFMAERLCGKHEVREKLAVIPPWPHVDAAASPADGAGLTFRETHALQGKRVIMYSGNLSPVHPVTTVLEAARRLGDEHRLELVFVGAGLGRAAIESFVARHALKNVRTLPYQKFSDLHESLSAADVHLVSMGEAMAGIVHPCKIYSAMAVARPILALGPRASHIAEIVGEHDIGWHVDHGDTGGMVEALRRIASLEQSELHALGVRALRVAGTLYSRAELRRRFCDVVEHGVPGTRAHPSAAVTRGATPQAS